jgi:hypothetical protein
MLTPEILKVPTTTEWAVISKSQQNKYKHETTLEKVEPDRIQYGVRVNGLRYSMDHGPRWSPDASSFTQIQGRSFGFLMKFTKDDGTNFYSVIKPTNFIATRKDYDAYWDVEQARRTEARLAKQAQDAKDAEEYQKRREIETQRMAQAKPEAQHTAEVIAKNIEVLLGSSTRSTARVEVSADGVWEGIGTPQETYRTIQKGSITLQLKDFQRLLEKAMQD